jgi:hypothetical protein
MKRRFLIILLLLICSSPAAAQSVMFGKRLVSKGDDVARVRDIAGAPDKVDTIPADQYSPTMEIWTYRRKGSSIALWIVGGKVVQAQEQAAASIENASGRGSSSR